MDKLSLIRAVLCDGETSEKPQCNDSAPWKIGEQYFIRAVTYHVTGRLVWVGPQELVLEDACWIADSGKFHDAVKSGEYAETEPFVDRVIVGRGAIVDATISKSLPRRQK